jgi:hypothetical protein
MQAGFFYPFKLVLYFASFDRNGLLSERAFNQFYVFSHWLAAFWMFLLVRYLKLGNLAALTAGICFGLGGFVQWTAWLNLLDAMAWLPLVVLFVLKALEGGPPARQFTNACAAGLALGMTFLAGGLHIAIMDVLVAASLTAYLWLSKRENRSVFWIASILAAIVLISVLFGAVQLLPSFEYSRLAYRWVGADTPIRPLERVSYPLMAQWAFGPQSLFSFVLGQTDAGKSDSTPYFGVLPLILTIIGIWKYWTMPLVRYLAALAALAWFYSWGGLSLLHGVMYLAPFLDVAREPDRFIYLTHFAMAVLAGFGVQFLFEDRKPGGNLSLSALMSVLQWATAGFAALLAAASLGLPIAVTEKTYLSFFFITASFTLLLFLQRARKREGAKFILVF